MVLNDISLNLGATSYDLLRRARDNTEMLISQAQTQQYIPSDIATVYYGIISRYREMTKLNSDNLQSLAKNDPIMALLQMPIIKELGVFCDQLESIVNDRTQR
jgi:hypothetical protein